MVRGFGRAGNVAGDDESIGTVRIVNRVVGLGVRGGAYSGPSPDDFTSGGVGGDAIDADPVVGEVQPAGV